MTQRMMQHMMQHMMQGPRRLIMTDTTAVRTAESSTVISRDDALTLGKKVFAMSQCEHANLMINHQVQMVVRLANGQVLLNNDGESRGIGISAGIGGKYQVSIGLDQLDDTSLKHAVAKLDALAALQPGKLDSFGAVPEEPLPIPEAKLWSDTTARALTTARETALIQMLEPVRSAKLIGAGVLAITAYAQLILYKSGLTAYHRETDTQCMVRARGLDGKSSGWAGAASRDWTRIDPAAVAQRAVEITKLGADPVALEPGRRTAILGPTAVAQLLRAVGLLFDRDSAEDGGTPLSSGQNGGTKMGMRIFDPRLSLSVDLNDPDGSAMPYIGGGYERPSDQWAYPLTSTIFVKNGTLVDLPYGTLRGAIHGMPYNRRFATGRLAPSPGTPTMTIDEMISHCQEGIYVNQLSDVALVDGGSGLLTGVTRDGCFLIKNGKIAKAVKNFRILESPFFIFNKVDAIGTSERACLENEIALGTAFPLITPALMVRDFNFSAMSDAV